MTINPIILEATDSMIAATRAFGIASKEATKATRELSKTLTAEELQYAAKQAIQEGYDMGADCVFKRYHRHCITLQSVTYNTEDYRKSHKLSFEFTLNETASAFDPSLDPDLIIEGIIAEYIWNKYKTIDWDLLQLDKAAGVEFGAIQFDMDARVNYIKHCDPSRKEARGWDHAYNKWREIEMIIKEEHGGGGKLLGRPITMEINSWLLEMDKPKFEGVEYDDSTGMIVIPSLNDSDIDGIMKGDKVTINGEQMTVKESHTMDALNYALGKPGMIGEPTKKFGMDFGYDPSKPTMILHGDEGLDFEYIPPINSIDPPILIAKGIDDKGYDFNIEPHRPEDKIPDTIWGKGPDGEFTWINKISGEKAPYKDALEAMELEPIASDGMGGESIDEFTSKRGLILDGLQVQQTAGNSTGDSYVTEKEAKDYYEQRHQVLEKNESNNNDDKPKRINKWSKTIAWWAISSAVMTSMGVFYKYVWEVYGDQIIEGVKSWVK